MDLEKLQRLAKKVRIDIIEMLKTAKTGHPGGALSLVEILIILYFVKMHIDPRRPQLDLSLIHILSLKEQSRQFLDF